MNEIDTRFVSEKQVVENTPHGQLVRWTSSAATDNHLYFTSPSVTRDGRYLVFLSERTGRVNLFACARSDGHIHQISDNRRGVLHSYCWPWGGHLGLSKASPVLDEVRNRVYYIQDGTVLFSDIESPRPTTLCRLPAGWLTGFTHVSPDGSRVCVPVLDPRADVPTAQNQADQLTIIPRLLRRVGAGSRLLEIDTDTGSITTLCWVPIWVTHVQYDPTGSGRIIFNREGDRLDNLARTWCLETDGSTRPLYDQPEDESAVHENWSADGSMIVYHGSGPDGSYFAGRRWDGSLVFSAQVPEGGTMHVTPTPDGFGFLMDSYDGVLRKRSWDETQRSWIETELCRHGANFSGELDQDNHVHPVAHRGGVVFSSNRHGASDVYELLYP